MEAKREYTVIGAGVGILIVIAALLIWSGSWSSRDTASNANSQPTPQTMSYTFPGVLADEKIQNKKAVITTAKGVIEFDLLAEAAPKSVSNFVYLAGEGFYDGLTFHRVEPGFVIQGGDPIGTGGGGPGYEFEDEPVVGEYTEGAVAMANAGPDTNGSQFFITLGDQSTNLTKSYNLFGRVTKGMEVVKSIAVGDVMDTVHVVSR